MQPIEKLKHGVYEWLVDHELDRDTRFYTPEEWQARDEPYLGSAELILVFEGGLFQIINGCHAANIPLYDDLVHFVQGHGYFFELGHTWSMGFYPLPARCLHPSLRIYSEHP